MRKAFDEVREIKKALEAYIEDVATGAKFYLDYNESIKCWIGRGGVPVQLVARRKYLLVLPKEEVEDDVPQKRFPS